MQATSSFTIQQSQLEKTPFELQVLAELVSESQFDKCSCWWAAVFAAPLHSCSDRVRLDRVLTELRLQGPSRLLVLSVSPGKYLSYAYSKDTSLTKINNAIASKLLINQFNCMWTRWEPHKSDGLLVCLTSVSFNFKIDYHGAPK